MRFIRLFILASFFNFLVVPAITQAQGLANYGFVTGVDASKWVDMTYSNPVLTCSDNDALASAVLSIGFSFPFGNSSYSQYSVNTDGNLRLGGTVTGTDSYSPPFSSYNADRNNPKINAFGCDGYGTLSHYVKAKNQTLPSGETILVLEFCMGTYSTITRDNLYKWQIHLHPNGNIDIVFPSAADLPSAPPAVSHQCGICISGSDGWVISSSTNTAQHFTSGTLATNPANTWFDANRYYTFVHSDNISCPQPTNITIGNVTTNGVTLSWTAGGNESLWELAIGGTVYYPTTTSYTLSNLNANEPYTASVRAICAAGDTSLASQCTFRTACYALSSLPYSNGFEDEPYYPGLSYIDAMPYCWSRINDASGSSNYYPYVTSSTDYVHSGSKGLFWKHGFAPNLARNEYAVLPAVDLNQYDISDLTLSFFARTTGPEYHPMPFVGVMTNPGDTSTFTPVLSFSATDITDQWQLFAIPLQSYTGTGSYVAIKWSNPGAYSYLAIDDIFLTNDWCNIPLHVTASAIADAVTVSWDRNDGTSFSVALGNDTVNSVTDTFYTFTNLYSNTVYSYAVAAECPSTRGMFVEGSIRTQCSFLNLLPYSEDFEEAAGITTNDATENNLPFCWNYHNADEGTLFSGYPVVYNNSEKAHSGSQSMRFFSTATNADQYAIMPITNATLYPVNHLKVSFWMSAHATSYNTYCVVGVMSDPTDANTFVAVDTVYTYRSTVYANHTVLLSSYTGPHGCVAFKFPQQATGSNYGYIDDIVLEDMPACPYVVSHNVVTTASAASFTWAYEHGYSEGPESYEVRYGFTSDNLVGASTITVSNPELILTGLEPDTSYTVSIRYVCSESSNPAYIFNFSTLALPCVAWNSTGDCIAISSCVAPAVFVEETEVGNIVLSWLPGYQETTWRIDYRAAEEYLWYSLFQSTNNTSYTFSENDLQSNTRYQFRVTANCTDNTVASIVTYNTHCLPVDLPYSYGFEDDLTNDIHIDSVPCWHYYGNLPYNYYYNEPYVSSSVAHTGSRCLVWNGYVYRTQFITLPLVNTMDNPINSLRLSFWAKATNASSDPVLKVGVMQNPDDTSTFQFVDSVVVNHSTSIWNRYEVVFDGFAGVGSCIALCAESPSSFWVVNLDDFILEYTPECPRITGLAASNITHDSATLSWNATQANMYEVHYGLHGFAFGTGTTVSTQQPSLRIGDMMFNTEYDVYVRGICGEDTGEWSFVYTFRTDCAAISILPFFEDFESYPASSSLISNTPFINCWTRLNNSTTIGCIPQVSSNNNHTPGGQNATFWFNTFIDDYGDYMYMILPLIDTSLLPINTLRLIFWSRTYGSDIPRFEVGVMNNNIDTAFQMVDTLSVNTGSLWNKYHVDFDNYHGTGSYIAIRALKSATTTYAYIDDILLEQIPPCPRVEDLIVVNTTRSSATIAWTDTSNNASWFVEYDTLDFEPGTSYIVPHQVFDTFCLISGLDSGSLYHVYVYPECLAGVASRHITLTTLATSPVSVPYRCTFESSGNNGWNFANGSQNNYWTVGNFTNNGGERSMYITDDGNSNHYGSNSSSVFAFRQFNLTQGDYLFSFDWKAAGELNSDFLRVALVPDNVQLISGSNCGFGIGIGGLPGGGIPLDGDIALCQHPDWQTYTQQFFITTPGIYKLVFYWRNNEYNHIQPPAAIDNIFFINNYCPAVSDINANVGIDSLFITWTPGSYESGWEVTIGDSIYYVNDNAAYIANGLQPNTDYAVQIRAICSEGDTSLPSITSFQTLCDFATLPFFENFDIYTSATNNPYTGIIPPCWKSILTGSGSSQSDDYLPQIYCNPYNIIPHSGHYCYKLDGVGYHIMPPMPVSLNQLTLSFWDYVSSTYSALEVGVMEGNTFVPIQNIELIPGLQTHHEVDFSGYTGSSRTIAFHNYNVNAMYGISSHYIDDILVDYPATCPTVVNVTSVGSTTTSIDVDWTDRVSPIQWQIKYDPKGWSAGNSPSNNSQTLFVNSHPVTITGLNIMGEYDFFVRPICSATDTGEWSFKATLSTSICDSGFDAFTGAPLWTSATVPLSTNGRYSLSETIIDSAELAGIVDIEGIAFSSDDVTQMNCKNNVSIWLQPTDLSTFAASSDFIALDTFTAVKVFQGNLNCSQGWNYFWFDNIFTWNGHSNILVIVDDNSNQYCNEIFNFNISPCDGNKSLSGVFSFNPDPTDLPSFVNSMSLLIGQRPTMKLVSCGDSCFKPSALPVTDITTESATLNWNSSATTFEVIVKSVAENTWPDTLTVDVQPSTVNCHLPINNLQPSTPYMFWVRALCDETSGTFSNWDERFFVTNSLPCIAPTNLHTTDIGYTTATFAWTPDASNSQWILRIWSATGSVTQTLATDNCQQTTVDHLRPNTTYIAAVKADCGSGYLEGEFGDTIQFNTATCKQVTGVSVTDVTTKSVTVNWSGTQSSSPEDVLYFEIEYGDRNHILGTGTIIVVEGSNAYTLTDLEPDHEYSLYVRAFCEESVSGDWSDQVDFTTLEETEDINLLSNVNHQLSIIPNPATDEVTITLNGVMGQFDITIVDINGRVIANWNADDASEGTMNRGIDVSKWAKGTYFVRIKGENVNLVRKLVVN